MGITGIICEYNPLHLGHLRQLRAIKQADPQGAVVCLMSGNYVQRGHPAIFDKTLRAKAAVLCGADLVLELPLGACLSSAEGFAGQGVRILSGFCHRLSMGAETADGAVLMDTARLLVTEPFNQALRQALTAGVSFPVARQRALEQLGGCGAVLQSPNNILAVEYCKAILAQEKPMELFVLRRDGDYHATRADASQPSATAVRRLILEGKPWQDYVPTAAAACFRDAPAHALAWGERGILAKLRTMSDEEFEALPYGSEGLWRKLMHGCRRENTLSGILEATKSKRYTRTRLDRMVMCAFLGLDRAFLEQPAPYVRVLALSQRGREVLRLAKATGEFVNIGTPMQGSYADAEARAGALYGLFSESLRGPCLEEDYRVYVGK